MKFLRLSIICVVSIIPFKATAQDSLKESIKRGSDIYEDFCVSCHMSYGEGVKNVYPPLSKSDYLLKNREGSIRSIKYGQEGKIIVNGVSYNGRMTPPGLDDNEIADVMNYISNSWRNKNNKMFTEKEVSKVEK